MCNETRTLTMRTQYCLDKLKTNAVCTIQTQPSNRDFYTNSKTQILHKKVLLVLGMLIRVPYHQGLAHLKGKGRAYCQQH